MRLRNVKGAREIIDNSNYVIKEPYEYKGKIKNIFLNENKVYLEIGMGKGKFIIENAIKYPDINFIGIEKYDSVVVRALQRLEDIDLKNLKIMVMDASDIESVFEKEIDRIYLNFSDPWPKKRHAERRLSSVTFLNKYKNIFKDKQEIIMKTDNRDLFEFSVINFNNEGYKIENISLDLHKSNDEKNIETEYEIKFKDKMPIYKIEITK